MTQEDIIRSLRIENVLRKPIRDNRKIFVKSQFFRQINVEEFFFKSETLLQVLLKLLDPQITFKLSKFENSCNPRIAVKYKTIFEVANYFFCHMIIAPAVSQCHTPLPPPKWWSFVRKEFTIERKMVLSVINVEDTLGTSY